MLQVSHEHLSLCNPKFTPLLLVEPIIVNSLYMDSEKKKYLFIMKNTKMKESYENEQSQDIYYYSIWCTQDQ